jgi:hypothetical protein
LRVALLQAAEQVLERDGLAGLTLRAVARQAAYRTPPRPIISATSPALSASSPRSASASSTPPWRRREPPANVPLEKSMASAKAYVGYAQTHPGMYGLMFRTERLDMSRPSLCHAANASFAGLAHAVGASRHEQISETALSLEQAAAITRAWSLVHGFTMLLLDGRLADILRWLPNGTTVESLLEAMLKATLGRQAGS